MADLFELIKKSGINEADLLKYLPDSMVDLSSVMPLKDIFYIIDSIGGLKIAVPRILNPHSFLVKKLGIKKATVLSNYYQSDVFYFPKARRIKDKIKHAIIFQMYKDGISTNDIALQLDVSDRTVQKVVKFERDKKHEPN